MRITQLVFPTTCLIAGLITALPAFAAPRTSLEAAPTCRRIKAQPPQGR